MVAEPEPQRIARLTPVDDVLKHMSWLLTGVAPRQVALADASGAALAQDVVAGPTPAVSIALRDGWAVASDLTSDASSYAPVPLPAAVWVDTGTPMPAGTDAVAPLDAVALRDSHAYALAPVAPGEGVLPAGADCDPGKVLFLRTRHIDPVTHSVLAAAGVADVSVSRRIGIATARPADRVLDAACDLVAGCIAKKRCAVHRADDMAGALADTDAAIVIGGTGSGRNDESVHTLARLGRVEVHGVALSPGETTAFGMVGDKPVLLMPGRLDSVIAGWLVLGTHMLMCLSGPTTVVVERPRRVELTRKIASPLGMTEVAPLRCTDGKAEPIASGYWPLQAIAQANGWILVPPDSEGYPAGAQVVVESWL
jgi:molybdopterin biosynthesis enzyme